MTQETEKTENLENSLDRAEGSVSSVPVEVLKQAMDEVKQENKADMATLMALFEDYEQRRRMFAPAYTSPIYSGKHTKQTYRAQQRAAKAKRKFNAKRPK